jgi:signal peptidase I
VIETLIEDVLASGNAVEFRAAGDSMHPSIRSGELVVVERVDPGAIRRGDVVLARLARGLTAHRVLRITKDGRFVTRGDNAPACDEVFGAEKLIGRVRVARKWPAYFAIRRLLARARR